VAESTAPAARKRGPGRPFVKGVSGNPGGRRTPLFTQALQGKLTAARAERIAEQVLALAEAGDLEAIKLAWDRLEGKAVAREEQGGPGAFDLDLSAVETGVLKRALKRAV
jgi:hypothetical protein